MMKHLLIAALILSPGIAHAYGCAQTDMEGRGALYVSGFDAASQSGFSASCSLTATGVGALADKASSCKFTGASAGAPVKGSIKADQAPVCGYAITIKFSPATTTTLYSGTITGQITVNDAKDFAAGIGALVGSDANGNSFGGTVAITWIRTAQ